MTYDERQKQAEELEAKKQRGEKLTQEESRLLNVSKGMIKPGEVRNPKGRGKGVRSWSTHFKRLMGDEDFLKTIIAGSPREWDGIVGACPADIVAAGIIASVTRDVAQATTQGKPLSGSTLKAIELLNKVAYGDKVTHDIEEDGVFARGQIVFNVVPDREKPMQG